jgi:hypothetical protein
MDLKRPLIDAIPTTLGRLAFLSRILDREAGAYQPWLVGIPDSGEGLGKLHRDLVMEWLGASMEVQVEDAAAYFDSLPVPERRPPLSDGWYSSLVPPDTAPEYREHFLVAMPKVIAMALVRSG